MPVEGQLLLTSLRTVPEPEGSSLIYIPETIRPVGLQMINHVHQCRFDNCDSTPEPQQWPFV